METTDDMTKETWMFESHLIFSRTFFERAFGHGCLSCLKGIIKVFIFFRILKRTKNSHENLLVLLLRRKQNFFQLFLLWELAPLMIRFKRRKIKVFCRIIFPKKKLLPAFYHLISIASLFIERLNLTPNLEGWKHNFSQCKSYSTVRIYNFHLIIWFLLLVGGRFWMKKYMQIMASDLQYFPTSFMHDEAGKRPFRPFRPPRQGRSLEEKNAQH